MNSVLQCLIHTEPVAKFFAMELYLKHINQKNTYGTRGRLAFTFGELVFDSYGGKSKYVAPWDVKTQIARKAIQF